MTGRGVDQILPYPSDPHLYEAYMKSAIGYAELAEAMNGPIPKPVDFSYIWGEALEVLERRAPDARIINLETAVTTSEAWEKKGIYRMHPENIPCLTAARIDCAGAGRTLDEAQSPAIMEVSGKRRVIVFGFGSESSGIPRRWAATREKPGVDLPEDFSKRTVRQIARRVQTAKRTGDIVVASIHRGGNWVTTFPMSRSGLPVNSSMRPLSMSSTGVPLIMPKELKFIGRSRSSTDAGTSSPTTKGFEDMSGLGMIWR